MLYDDVFFDSLGVHAFAHMYSSCIALTMYPEVLAGVALSAAAPGLVLDPNPPPPAPPDFGNCM